MSFEWLKSQLGATAEEEDDLVEELEERIAMGHGAHPVAVYLEVLAERAAGRPTGGHSARARRAYRAGAGSSRSSSLRSARELGSPPVRIAARDAARRAVLTGEVLTIAHALALDVHGIEIVVDDVAVWRTEQAGVRGLQEGQTIYLHPQLHDPGSVDGRYLLAHEMIHLAQRRLPGTAHPGRAEEEATSLGRAYARGEGLLQPSIPVPAGPAHEDPTPDDDKLYANPIVMQRQVVMGGIVYKPRAATAWVAGLDRHKQGLASALQDLVGKAYSVALLNEMIGALHPAPKGGVEGRATQNDQITDYTVYNPFALQLVDWLEARGLKVRLDAEEKATLQGGVDAAETWADLHDALPLPAWMNEPLYWAVMGASQRTLLTRYGKALRAAQDHPSTATIVAHEEARTAVYDALHGPMYALEAIRADEALIREPAYRALWQLPALDPRDVTQVQPAPEDWIPAHLHATFFMLEALADAGATKKMIRSAEARRKFLARFATRLALADLETDGNQTLHDGVTKATRPPLDSELRSYPQLEEPFFDTPLGGEREFVMSIAFPDVFEAFRGYVYRWELVHIPSDDIAKLNETADDLAARGETPGTTDVLGSRLSRDSKYGRTDIQRSIGALRGILGEPGVGAVTLAAANAVLRMVGTVIATFVEALTKPRNEKTMPFGKEGLYVVRCSAVPTPNDDSPIDRAPSVAWLPVWVRPAAEMSKLRVHLDGKVRAGALARLAEIQQELKAPGLSPDQKKALVEERALIERGLDDRGDAQLELEREQLQQALTGVQAGSFDEKQIRKRLDEIGTILELRAERMKGATTDGSLEASIRISAAFVAEETGQTIRLLLEAFELPPNAGRRRYRLVDSTTKDSRTDVGQGATREDAIADAAITLLENSAYGRGYVTLSIPAETIWAGAAAGAAAIERTERIDRALGKLWMEAVENVATVASIAAVAAAPFTGGASLALLVPIGVIGAVPSAYRLADRAQQGTLRMDMATALDLVNILGAAAGVGQYAATSKAVMQGVQVGKGWMILGLGADGLGMAVAGAAFIEQLEAATADPKMPDGLKRAIVMQLVGSQLLQVGMAVGQQLAMRGKQSRAEHDSHIDLPESGMSRAPVDRAKAFHDAAGPVAVDIPIFLDTDGTRVAGRGVEIHFDADGYGLPTNLRVILGAAADPGEIAIHAQKAAALLKYQGFFGWLRELIDRLSARFRGKRVPKSNSRAWHAQHELDKLARLAKQYADDLAAGKLDPTAYDSKMKALESQAAVHAQAVNELDEGPGFIAAHDTITQAAIAADYPPPPVDHFYVENGDGTYQLRRNVDSAADPYKIEWQQGKPVAVPDPAGHGAGVPTTAKVGDVAGADLGQLRTTASRKLGIGPDQLSIDATAKTDEITIRQKPGGGYELRFKPGTPEALVHAAVDRHLQLAADLGPSALHRLTDGPSGLDESELASLVIHHGPDTVKWAGQSLDGTGARNLLGAVNPTALRGLQDISAADAQKNVDVYGKETIEKTVPPVTGRHLNIERAQLGEVTASGVAQVKSKKPGTLATHAENLEASTKTPATALNADSLIVDANILAGIKELMDGMAWSALQAHKRVGINYLRGRAKPKLQDLTTDPPARDMASIIGEGHDLRAAANVLAESAPRSGLDRRGFELTISRDSAQYSAVLAELARQPGAIGANKGAGDRSIVADAMFAKGVSKPTFMTGDEDIINRLFDRYGPGKTNPVRQRLGQKQAKAIAEHYHGTYEAVIPDGAGGTRTLTIILMV